jgi:hypothetical protein
MAKRKFDSGFVYIWFDKKHKRFYVGSHWGIPIDKYVCSSNWMIAAYRRRPEDFKRRILETVTTTRIDLYEREYAWLSLIKDAELGKRYYNLKKNKHVGTDYTQEVLETFSNVQKGKKQSPETIAKKTASIKKTMSTPEKKLELSAQAKAMWAREGHAENFSTKMSEVWASEEHRAKTIPNIIAALNSEETIKKISEASKLNWQDPVYRQLQSDKHLGIPQRSRTEEEKLANSEMQLKLWSSEEYRQKMVAAHLNSEAAMEASRQNIRKTHTPEGIAKNKEVKRMRHEAQLNDPEYRKMKKEAGRIAAMKRWRPETVST